jgi:hypothetical protein
MEMKQKYLENLKNGIDTPISKIPSKKQSLTQQPMTKGLGFGGLFSM